MNPSQVSSATDRGPRSHQEDRFVEKLFPASHPRSALLAVMDGHGGDWVSIFCARELWNLFRSCRETKPEAKIKHLFALADWHTNATTDVGSTLSVAWIRQNRCNEVVVGVLGDSPVIVVDCQGNVVVSPEHNVKNPAERDALLGRGGFCDEHYHYHSHGRGLQLTRALGDAEFGELVSRVPEVYTVKDPLYVIVATDGIFDCSHRKTRERVDKLVDTLSAESRAEDIMSWAKAQARGKLFDNATVLFWNGHPSRRRG